MHNASKGFSLIELMVVVGIIGILTTIALPAYANYQARSKLAAGLAELAGVRTVAELALGDGEALADISTLAGVQPRTQHCVLSGGFDAEGQGALACKVVAGPPQLSNAEVSWQRDSDGLWACTVTGLGKYGALAPRGCPAG